MSKSVRFNTKNFEEITFHVDKKRIHRTERKHIQSVLKKSNTTHVQELYAGLV